MVLAGSGYLGSSRPLSRMPVIVRRRDWSPNLVRRSPPHVRFTKWIRPDGLPVARDANTAARLEGARVISTGMTPRDNDERLIGTLGLTACVRLSSCVQQHRLISGGAGPAIESQRTDCGQRT